MTDQQEYSVCRMLVLGVTLSVLGMTGCVVHSNAMFTKGGYCNAPWSSERWVKCDTLIQIGPMVKP